MSPRATVLPLLLAMAGSLGCRGCHDDHPYVPYAIGESERGSIDTGGDAAPAASTASAPIDSGSAFAAEPAVVAPPGLSRWPVAGLVLDAPPGSAFVSAVVRDFDGDGSPDAFAIVRPAEGNDPGQVAFYRGAPRAPADAAIPPQATFAPSQDIVREPACTPLDRLIALGRRSVLVELGVQCPPRASSPPDRWIALLTGGAPPRVRLAATIVDLPGRRLSRSTPTFPTATATAWKTSPFA